MPGAFSSAFSNAFDGGLTPTTAVRLWPIGPHTPLFLSAPFTGSGVSVYASTGRTVTYRRLRALPRKRPPLRLGTEFPIADESVAKTARIASQAADPGEEIEIELDLSDYAGDALTVDVRHFRDHVENTGSQPRRLLLDADGNSDDEIRGRAILLTPEVRAGGIVRIRWRWEPSRDGLQPDLFKLQRTAGPTSPADVTTSNVGRGVYELDTPALSDSSAYTYQLIAQNTAGTVTATLLSGISITADATGPTAPGSLTIEAV